LANAVQKVRLPSTFRRGKPPRSLASQIAIGEMKSASKRYVDNNPVLTGGLASRLAGIRLSGEEGSELSVKV
jgi:hypothetical protein